MQRRPRGETEYHHETLPTQRQSSPRNALWSFLFYPLLGEPWEGMGRRATDTGRPDSKAHCVLSLPVKTSSPHQGGNLSPQGRAVENVHWRNSDRVQIPLRSLVSLVKLVTEMETLLVGTELKGSCIAGVLTLVETDLRFEETMLSIAH